MLKYFKSSIAFTVFAVALGFYCWGLQAAGIIAILGILEISLSFDNAVVNASVLKHWDQTWRDRFMTYGLPVAVIGMRVAFPLIIVGFVGHLGPIEALTLATKQPAEYARILTSAHHQIAAFGGTFLMMVFLKFFLDDNKEEHWLSWVEHPLTKLARFTEVLVLILLASVTLSLEKEEQASFLLAGVFGLAAYLLVEVIADLAGGDQEEGKERIIKQSIGGFLYLEMLDASFSFDGVIGAFALSTNIFIIALGLGIGAAYVRSLTVMLVEKGTMTQFRYLEHGAFWAIGALAIIMFIGVKHEVPEIVTGLIGAAAIITAVWSSHRANKRDAMSAAAVA